MTLGFLAGSRIVFSKGYITNGKGTPRDRPLSVLRILSEVLIPEYESPASTKKNDMIAPSTIICFAPGRPEANRLDPVRKNSVDKMKPK